MDFEAMTPPEGEYGETAQPEQMEPTSFLLPLPIPFQPPAPHPTTAPVATQRSGGANLVATAANPSPDSLSPSGGPEQISQSQEQVTERGGGEAALARVQPFLQHVIHYSPAYRLDGDGGLPDLRGPPSCSFSLDSVTFPAQVLPALSSVSSGVLSLQRSTLQKWYANPQFPEAIAFQDR